MAFEYFARRKVDIAVLEVGMGGRLDATNVIEPRVSVITDISLDHQKFLGDTVAEIAVEKAGIIRPGGVVVTLPQQPQANDVIGRTIMDLGARAVNAVPYVPPVSPASGEYRVTSGLRNGIAEAQPVSRYPMQVMGKEIMVETPSDRAPSTEKCSSGDCRCGGTWAAEIPGHGGVDRARHPRNALAGAVPGGAGRRTAHPNMCSMWRTILLGHGLCVRPSRLATRSGHSRLFLEPCGTRRLGRWRRFCFRWRSG